MPDTPEQRFIYPFRASLKALPRRSTMFKKKKQPEQPKSESESDGIDYPALIKKRETAPVEVKTWINNIWEEGQPAFSAHIKIQHGGAIGSRLCKNTFLLNERTGFGTDVLECTFADRTKAEKWLDVQLKELTDKVRTWSLMPESHVSEYTISIDGMLTKTSDPEDP